jgi:hypothetical protein
MQNFPMILVIYHSLFINKYHYSIFIFFCLFTLTFHCRFPVSPLFPYNIEFVQRGFTERVAFEERIPFVGRGFSCVLLNSAQVIVVFLSIYLVLAWRWLTEAVALVFAGLVLETAAGDACALHQHLPGHHVLQASHVVTTVFIYNGLYWLGLVKVGIPPSFPPTTLPN